MGSINVNTYKKVSSQKELHMLRGSMFMNWPVKSYNVWANMTQSNPIKLSWLEKFHQAAQPAHYNTLANKHQSLLAKAVDPSNIGMSNGRRLLD